MQYIETEPGGAMLRLVTAIVFAAPTVMASPALRLADGSTVTLRHHGGCVAAWRTDAGDKLLWYFTARLQAPLVATATNDRVTLRSDGALIARDDIQSSPPVDRKTSRYGFLRLYRPTGPCMFHDEEVRRRLSTIKVQQRVEGDRGAILVAGEWIYVAAGAVTSPRLIVRTTHKFLTEEDRMPRLLAAGQEIYSDAAGPEVLDDGNFAVARVLPNWAMEEAVSRLRIRRTFGDRNEPPKLTAKQWLQANEPLAVAGFKDKAVVMLDFWGVWCQPCVADLPKITELRRKVSSPNFVLIGVHSAQAADQLAAFLQKHAYPGPIAVDSGETAKAYGIDSWPTYVLIDKSGRVVHFGSALPTAETVTSLLP